MNQWTVLIWAIFAPSRAFRRILQRPRSALAILMIVACSLTVHVTIHSRIDMAAAQRITSVQLNAEKPEGKLSDQDVAEKAQRAINMRRIGGYLVYVLGVPLAVAVLTLVIWLLFGAWSEGLGFKKCYRIAAHVALPFAVRQLLSVAVIFTYPSIDPAHTWGLFKTNLGALISTPFLPGLFLLDPFWIWTGVLAGLAGRTMGRGRVWSTGVAVAVWLLLAFAGRSL